MKNLDLVDRKILYELDCNSRLPNSRIAKNVGVSRDVVNYRIKRMEEKGYIKGYVPIIDFVKLGNLNIRIFLNLKNTNPEKEKEIVEYFVKEKNTSLVAKTDGRYDVGVAFWVRDVYVFKDFWDNFIQKYNYFLGEYRLSIYTKLYYFRRDYLLEKRKYGKIVSTSIGKASYDKLDSIILAKLSENARTPIIKIARDINVPVKTVAYRIKQLEKKKIILGYGVNIDLEKLKIIYYKVHINLNKIDVAPLNEYAKRHPNITFIDETIGGWDFEIDLEVNSHKEFLDIMEDMKTRFSQIEDYEYFTSRGFEKFKLFIPQD